jgi:carotenoid 1,2-hydratase
VRFDKAVPPGGYAWWYVDAVSDDGRHALTLIAFIGSVFSPYYAWANSFGRRGEAENFCAMNVALYGPGGAWAMTERGRKKLQRDAGRLQIGPSAFVWDGNALTAEIEEIAVPIPRQVRGVVRLIPQALQARSFVLDSAGRHRWRPIAPAARVEVVFEKPGMDWRGHGYFDSNEGDAPLGEDFSAWHWSRAASGGEVFYDAKRLDGTELALALRMNSQGEAFEFEPPPMRDLPGTRWRVKRKTRADAGGELRVLQTLEDAPFYARSKIVSRVDGVLGEAIHESLDLDRFGMKVVKAMLPFRMPRWGR